MTARMTSPVPRRSRLATGALVLVGALAVFSASTAWADEMLDNEMGPTKCGAGTVQQCGTQPITKCELDISFNFSLFSRDFGFHFKSTNCEVIGQTPIYKDTPPCKALDPAVGALAGAGC